VPFLLAAVFRWARTRDRCGLIAVLAATTGSTIIAAIVSELMRSLGFRTTTPTVRVSDGAIGLHAKWLLDGVLRIGNGITVGHRAHPPVPLVLAAAVATVAAILVLCWQAATGIVRPASGGLGRARDLYGAYWAGALLCAAAAYVLTNVATAPTDRYLLIIVPALAATVPLMTGTTRGAWLTALVASVFVLASIGALIGRDARSVIYDGASATEPQRILSYLKSQHLSVGYAGYWDAATLDWLTDEQAHVFPITDSKGPLEPMYQCRVDSWYSPRRHTPTFLLLAPYDLDLHDRLPSGLPRPEREAQLGPVTIAIYPFDIARYLHRPSRAPRT
jgi:hypothetical protein